VHFIRHIFVDLKAIRDKLIMEYLSKENGVWKCTHCDYSTKRCSNMTEHVESIHVDDGLAYECKFCPKTLRSRNMLRGHVLTSHKQVRATKENLGL
jgi:hypothetical protein